MNPEIFSTQNFLFASQGHIPAARDWIFCQNNVGLVQFYSYIYLYEEMEKDKQYPLIAQRRHLHVTCSSVCRSKDGSEALRDTKSERAEKMCGRRKERELFEV